MVTSYNDRLILEAYLQGQGLKAEVKSGFAMVSQKKAVIGLTLLVDANLSSGKTLNKGSIVYFNEETLVDPNSGAKSVKKSDFIEGEFIVMDFRHAVAVVFVDK